MAVVLDFIEGIDTARQCKTLTRFVGAVNGTGDVHPRLDAVRDTTDIPGFRAVDAQGFARGTR